ncbi:unnamed protein product [Notodromas monacha]|uniref:Uncharacterized protein n=1 Tax=Notodromas monacha TaxID=399045 RepID=A0A7R9BMI8_9CRUS|nr:unnamed protein product [Notodromas monacha]CAG0916889.1 unnamed protein product [Notodromas monacha]
MEISEIYGRLYIRVCRDPVGVRDTAAYSLILHLRNGTERGAHKADSPGVIYCPVCGIQMFPRLFGPPAVNLLCGLIRQLSATDVDDRPGGSRQLLCENPPEYFRLSSLPNKDKAKCRPIHKQSHSLFSTFNLPSSMSSTSKIVNFLKPPDVYPRGPFLQSWTSGWHAFEELWRIWKQIDQTHCFMMEICEKICESRSE